MKKLVWLSLIIATSAQAKTFDCGGDGDYITDDVVTVTGDGTVYITEYTKDGDKSRSEVYFVGVKYGDYRYEKQVINVLLRKDAYGEAYAVRLRVEGDTRNCEEQ